MHNSREYVQYLAKNALPSLVFKEDMELNKWQESAREKLKELLGLPLLECEDNFTIRRKVKKDDYTQIEFEFYSEPGYVVPCGLLIPDKITEPLPVVICLQGHSSGMHISLGNAKFDGDKEIIAGGRDFAVQAVREGYCAIAMDQRYMGGSGQSDKGSPACLSDNAAMATLLMGRTAIGERVWDICRLIDVIEKHLTQYIDVDRIICMGNSGGGTATFYASCIEERIWMSIPSCSVCTYEASIMAMYHCPCNYIPGIRKYFNMGDLGCLIAPRNLIVVCGKEDKIFPLHGVEESFDTIYSAYKKIGKENQCYLVKGDGGHKFYPDDVWPIVKAKSN